MSLCIFWPLCFFKDFKIWARTRMQCQLALNLEGWSWPLPTNYVSHQAWLTQCWGLYARQALHHWLWNWVLALFYLGYYIQSIPSTWSIKMINKLPALCSRPQHSLSAHRPFQLIWPHSTRSVATWGWWLSFSTASVQSPYFFPSWLPDA